MQNRLAHQADQLLEDVFAVPFGGIQHRRQGGIYARSPLRAKTAHDLAMDYRGAQGAFLGIVIRWHVGPMQKNKQVLTMDTIAVQQSEGRFADEFSL